ncbi:hypothetical protein CKO28_01065 [Rhodovibrio sodomensis]|uniref:Uncharacterized protein n=1 Tax=Rhodovibrio sodomensis TaxID=1088 RepID=A0ABS1DAK5_9PROT|nr:hypothetical protein [Rhodovibrio sodomensis]MBK1666633.1 hypothetical protein [Rhodovibrio sodomensis]
MSRLKTFAIGLGLPAISAVLTHWVISDWQDRQADIQAGPKLAAFLETADLKTDWLDAEHGDVVMIHSRIANTREVCDGLEPGICVEGAALWRWDSAFTSNPEPSTGRRSGVMNFLHETLNAPHWSVYARNGEAVEELELIQGPPVTDWLYMQTLHQGLPRLTLPAEHDPDGDGFIASFEGAPEAGDRRASWLGLTDEIHTFVGMIDEGNLGLIRHPDVDLNWASAVVPGAVTRADVVADIREKAEAYDPDLPFFGMNTVDFFSLAFVICLGLAGLYTLGGALLTQSDPEADDTPDDGAEDDHHAHPDETDEYADEYAAGPLGTLLGYVLTAAMGLAYLLGPLLAMLVPGAAIASGILWWLSP